MHFAKAALLGTLFAGVQARGGFDKTQRLSHHHHHNHRRSPVLLEDFDSSGGNETETLELEKRYGSCAFPYGSLMVAVTPGSSNAGWAMSPDQPCTPGSYCPYACEPGYLMDQWDPAATSYTYPESMYGGLYCGTDGTMSKPFPDRDYCKKGVQAISARNAMSSEVAFCQTVLPGNEAMLIPTSVDPGSTTGLACPDTSYWASTAAHYYINPAGVSAAEGCVWGSTAQPWGNWAPYVAGANTDGSGNTFVKVGWNPIYTDDANWNAVTPSWAVSIECTGGNCNGTPCRCDPSLDGPNTCSGGSDGAGGAAFCVVTVPPGGSANIVVYDTATGAGSSSSSNNNNNNNVKGLQLAAVAATESTSSAAPSTTSTSSATPAPTSTSTSSTSTTPTSTSTSTTSSTTSSSSSSTTTTSSSTSSTTSSSSTTSTSSTSTTSSSSSTKSSLLAFATVKAAALTLNATTPAITSSRPAMVSGLMYGNTTTNAAPTVTRLQQQYQQAASATATTLRNGGSNMDNLRAAAAAAAAAESTSASSKSGSVVVQASPLLAFLVGAVILCRL